MAEEVILSGTETNSLKLLKQVVPGSRFVNGREYTDQENVQYVLPKDVEEMDRLRQQNWMLKIAFQGNFSAPVDSELKKGITVLDSGCGPGTWTLEMAQDYPNSTFYGADMAPVFPEQKPKNCEFHLVNLNEGLPFPDNHFDFIHQRLLVAGLTADGWEKTLSEFVRVLKPGGWIELKELQFYCDSTGPRTAALLQTICRVVQSRGLVPNVAVELESLLKGKGLEDVQVNRLQIPSNHGGLLGSLHWKDTSEVVVSMRPVLAMVEPEVFKPDDVFAEFLTTIGNECAEHKTMGNWFDVYGRKPLN